MRIAARRSGVVWLMISSSLGFCAAVGELAAGVAHRPNRIARRVRLLRPRSTQDSVERGDARPLRLRPPDAAIKRAIREFGIDDPRGRNVSRGIARREGS